MQTNYQGSIQATFAALQTPDMQLFEHTTPSMLVRLRICSCLHQGQVSCLQHQAARSPSGLPDQFCAAMTVLLASRTMVA